MEIMNWLKDSGFDVNTSFNYQIGDEVVTLTLAETLEGAKKKIRNEATTLEVLVETKRYFDEYVNPPFDKKEAIKKELTFFLHQMGYNVAWTFSEHRDLKWSNFSYPEEFLRWWMNERGLTEQQMLCEHDGNDTYAQDGQFYNSVGECKKCNCHHEDWLDNNDSIELVYKAWSRK